MDGALDAIPPAARELALAVTDAVHGDPRLLGVTIGGSAVAGGLDEFSDLDFVVVCRDEAHAAVLAEARGFAERIGPLLAAFTGEHVGEPRLLIALYGPPLVHVDLKFLAAADLASRVEDGLVLGERDGAVSAALRESPANWPRPDPQWIEDRFWVWVHYTAAKLARGELFECLEALAFLRRLVLGPLLAVGHGERPQGVRRIERYAPEAVPALQATVGDHSRAGCAAALRAAIELYRELRFAPALDLRAGAEAAVVRYLDEVAPA